MYTVSSVLIHILKLQDNTICSIKFIFRFLDLDPPRTFGKTFSIQENWIKFLKWLKFSFHIC